MDLKQLRHAYRNDPMFRGFVMQLENFIETMKLSPSELRDAAMLAVFNVEQRNPPKQIVLSESQARYE